jgi:hypothetical protein
MELYFIVTSLPLYVHGNNYEESNDIHMKIREKYIQEMLAAIQ